MGPSLRLLGLLTVAALCSCSPRPTLSPIAPARLLAAGDTARFGPGPIALDPMGRLLQLDLRENASLVTFALDRENRIEMLGTRYLPAGRHTIPPTWEGRGTSYRRAYYNPGRQALLIVVSEEDWRFGIPGSMPATVWYGEDWLEDWRRGIMAAENVMTPRYALENLAPAMLRRPSSAWAAYLIVP
jgi:hypothetical protein